MFEPIAKVDENVYFPLKDEAYRVKYVEPLPRLVVDFGTIDAGETLSRTEVSEISMPDGELGQFRFKPLDDLELSVYQPKTLSRFLTRNSQFKVDKETDPELAQVYVHGDNPPYMAPGNPTEYETPMARVEFEGWRLQLEELPAKPETYAGVPVSGKPVR